MAEKKISDLTSKTNVADADEFVFVDKATVSGDDASSTGQTSDGTYTYHYVSTGTGNMWVDVSADFVGDIDNISVKEIHRRGIGVQMHGYISYGDSGVSADIEFFRHYKDANDSYSAYLGTAGSDTGEPHFFMDTNGTAKDVAGATDAFSPGVNVPFKIAGRFLDNSLQGAADGVATTENTTPVGLPDLSGVDLEVAYAGPALHITKFNIFAENIKASDGTFKMDETFLTGATT